MVAWKDARLECDLERVLTNMFSVLIRNMVFFTCMVFRIFFPGLGNITLIKGSKWQETVYIGISIL